MPVGERTYCIAFSMDFDTDTDTFLRSISHIRFYSPGPSPPSEFTLITASLQQGETGYEVMQPNDYTIAPASGPRRDRWFCGIL